MKLNQEIENKTVRGIGTGLKILIGAIIIPSLLFIFFLLMMGLGLSNPSGQLDFYSVGLTLITAVLLALILKWTMGLKLKLIMVAVAAVAAILTSAYLFL